MDTFENTAAFNQRALQEEIRKRDEAATRWKTARDEVYRLLRDDASDLRELVVAEAYAEHCAKELRVQQAFVNRCREWVEESRKALAEIQPEIDQLRSHRTAVAVSRSKRMVRQAHQGLRATEPTARPVESRDRPQNY